MSASSLIRLNVRGKSFKLSFEIKTCLLQSKYSNRKLIKIFYQLCTLLSFVERSVPPYSRIFTPYYSGKHPDEEVSIRVNVIVSPVNMGVLRG